MTKRKRETAMEKANTIGVKQQWKKFFFTRKNRRSAKGEENEQLATCHFPLVSRKVFKFLMCYYLEISRRDGEMSKSVIFQNFIFSLFFSHLSFVYLFRFLFFFFFFFFMFWPSDALSICDRAAARDPTTIVKEWKPSGTAQWPRGSGGRGGLFKS